jgi:[ribosomal protein S18]-alanine N-acetyltransferase
VPTLIQATSSDTSEIANFLDQAKLVYRHLDWTPLLDWVDYAPFLKYYQNQQLEGILACPPDPPGVCWIKCFASNQASDSGVLFHSLLAKAKLAMPSPVEHIYSLGLNEWFEKILKLNGFEHFQDVIVLKYGHKLLEEKLGGAVIIRPMELSDIGEVARIDHASFEPIWTISASGLQSAFFQAEHASVAEINGNPIGYELSTANLFSAHLARVAVLPEHQHEKIGFQLVNGMINYFLKRGIKEITVNTQDVNHASLNLYKKIGFFPTGDRFPVYRIPISAITGQ